MIQRRREDGIVDREQVNRAVDGRDAKLTKTEAHLAVYRLSQTRGWGLRQIADQLGYSPSQVAAILARQRKAKP